MNTTASRPTRKPATAVIILLLVALLLAGGAVYFAAKGRPPEDVPASPPELLPVAVVVVTRTNVPERVTHPGRVEADAEVSLAAEQSGRILWLGAAQGDAVVVGQPLMQIDNRSPTAALHRAEVSLRQAESDLRRMQELRDAGSLAPSEYEAAANRRELAGIAVQEALTDLEKCRLVAPVAGVVEERLVDVGEYAVPGMPAFRIVGLDPVKVVVHVPERDVVILKAGDTVPLTVDALPGRTFEGPLTHIAAVADARSNTFRTEVRLANPEHLLRPGVIARASLTRRVLRDALSVPLRALVPVKGQYVAFCVKDGRAVRRLVTIAAIVDSAVVVREGLQEGDAVVVEGQRALTDGAAVTVTAATSPAPASPDAPPPQAP